MELPLMSSSIKESDSSLVIFDTDGDLVLVVNEGEEQRWFRVSTKVMRLASPVWRVMLDPSGPFQEAKRENNEIAFPEDDPDVLCILLHIIHLRPLSLPGTLEVDELMALAILCQKYDTAELVGPWVQAKWAGVLFMHAHKDGFEALFLVAWVFQDVSRYATSLAKRLILDCNLDDQGRFEVQVEHRGLLEDHVPPVIMEQLHQFRSMLIKDLSATIDDFISRYQDPSGVQCKLKSEDCDTLIYGSLVKTLRNAGLLQIMATQTDNSCIENSRYTLSQLIKRLTTATFATYPTLSSDQDHSQCNPSAEWIQKVANLKEFTCHISPDGFEIRTLSSSSLFGTMSRGT